MAQSYLLGRAERVSNNSFNVYRKEGRRLFAWGVKQGLLPRDFLNPFEEVEKKRHEKNRRGPPPIEHVVKVYMVATPDQKDLLLAYLITGARKSEILKWKWLDVDFEKRIYALHTRKSVRGEIKTTHHEMPMLLYELLKRRFKKRHPILPYVFWHKYWDRKKNGWREDRYQNLNKFTKRLCERANVPAFNLHQLRHLATTVLKDKANMSLAELQRFLRHEHQKTTEIYAGHLELGTKKQTDFLANFWRENLDPADETSSKTSSIE
jgi:integrase